MLSIECEFWTTHFFEFIIHRIHVLEGLQLIAELQDRNFYSLHLFRNRLFRIYFPRIYFYLYSMFITTGT